ncbi:MAG: hypothetical protein KY391_03240 [Actinobacteria bacterium]|nr:hypothetical protein [Actinomycetota bacterium]
MNRVPAAALGATGWILFVAAVAVEVTVLVSIGFLPNSFAAAVLLLLGAFPLVLALQARSLRRELLAGSGELATFVFLFVLFAVAWVTAWESQWFEPKLTYETGGGDVHVLIGATRPPRWNLGRFIAAAFGAFWGIGLLALAAPAEWRRYGRRRRAALGVGFVVAALLVAGSVPVLRAREEARREHARDACYQVEVAEGAEPSAARQTCRDA